MSWGGVWGGGRNVPGGICRVPITGKPERPFQAVDAESVGKSLAILKQGRGTDLLFCKQHSHYHVENGLNWGRHGGSWNTQEKKIDEFQPG